MMNVGNLGPLISGIEVGACLKSAKSVVVRQPRLNPALIVDVLPFQFANAGRDLIWRLAAENVLRQTSRPAETLGL